MSESDSDDDYHEELQPNSKCLFCATGLPLNFTLVNGKVTPINKENDLAPCFTAEGGTLDKQLQVVFILRNILHIPEGKLCKFLAEFSGEMNPQFWFQVCGVCGDAVKLFYDTLKEISKLRKRLDRVSNQLKTKVYVTRNEEAIEEGNAVIWKEIREEIVKDFKNGSKEINVELPQEEDIQPMDDDHDDSDNGSEQWEPDENHSNSEIDEYQPPTKSRKRKLTRSSFPPSKKNWLPADAPKFRDMSDVRLFDASNPNYTVYKKGRISYFKCRQCPAAFCELKRILQHLTLHEPGANVTICSTSNCGWYLNPNQATYLRHNVRHHQVPNRKYSGQAEKKRTLWAQSELPLEPSPPSSPASQNESENGQECEAGKSREAKKKKKPIYYKCPECPAKLGDNRRLIQHSEVHKLDAEEVTPCQVCGWVVKTQLINRHMARRHSKFKIVLNSKQIQGNIVAATPQKFTFVGSNEGIPYYCDHCHMIFTARYKLQLHFNACHAESHGCLTCTQPDCELKFASKQLLNFHLKKTHPQANAEEERQPADQEQELKCKYCEQTFLTKNSVDFHIAKEHQADLLTCVPCNKKYKNYQRYRTHLESTKAHAGTKTYPCEFCGKRYSSEWLVSHKRQEHGAELGLEPISCNECSKIMSSRRALRDHMKAVHLKIKTLACEFCGEVYAVRQNLRSHIRRHHEGSGVLLKEQHHRLEKGEDGEETWLCEFCPLQFPNLQSVRTHLLGVHYDQLKHVCDGCEKRFCTSLGLHQHRKSCTEVEKEQQEMFPCQFCSKEYYSLKDVRSHERKTHKDRFTHACQKCDKVFRTATRLTNHTMICGGAPTELKGESEDLKCSD